MRVTVSAYFSDVLGPAALPGFGSRGIRAEPLPIPIGSFPGVVRHIAFTLSGGKRNAPSLYLKRAQARKPVEDDASGCGRGRRSRARR